MSKTIKLHNTRVKKPDGTWLGASAFGFGGGGTVTDEHIREVAETDNINGAINQIYGVLNTTVPLVLTLPVTETAGDILEAFESHIPVYLYTTAGSGKQRVILTLTMARTYPTDPHPYIFFFNGTYPYTDKNQVAHYSAYYWADNENDAPSQEFISILRTMTTGSLATTLDESVTDSQYPSAKAVYDYVNEVIGGIEDGTY